MHNKECPKCKIEWEEKEKMLTRFKTRKQNRVNSDSWTFLTYMTYDNKEKRIPRNEKFEAEISK